MEVWIMKHNHAHKSMLTSALAQRVGWLGLIVMLGCGLLCPPLIRESAGQSKVPPRRPQKQQVEIEKKTGVENNAMVKMLLGTLKARVTIPRVFRRVVLEYTLSIVLDDQSPQTVNTDGTYLFKDLKPGTHKVKLVGRCWRDRSQTVTIRSDQTTTLNLRLGTSNGFCGG
jgi:hypothetical protein